MPRVDASEIRYVIERVMPAVDTSEGIEQSNCVAFRNDLIWAYNDELCICHKSPFNIEGAVRAKDLYQLMKSLEGQGVRIREGEGELLVKWGSGKTKISVQNISLPIDKIGVENEEDWKELPDDFSEAVSFVSFCTSTDRDHPLLTCIHVSENKVLTSDNFRVCRHDLSGEIDDILNIPVLSAEHIAKYTPVQYHVGDNWIYFRNDEGSVMAARQLQGKYPPVEKIIEDDYPARFSIPGNFIDVLKRASIFVEDTSKQEQEVHFTVSSGNMLIKAQNPYGQFEENMDVEYGGDEFSFTTSPAFLREASAMIEDVQVGEDTMLFEGQDFLHVVPLYD